MWTATFAKIPNLSITFRPNTWSGSSLSRTFCTPIPMSWRGKRCRSTTSTSPNSLPWTSSRVWATAVWAGCPPVSWTRWPRSISRRSATAFATNTASSASHSAMAGRLKARTSGSTTETPGNSRSQTTWSRSASAGGPSTIPTATAPTASAGFRPRPSWASPTIRWRPAIAPRRSTCCASGAPAPHANSICSSLTSATTRARSSRRPAPRMSPRCSTPMTIRPKARNCA